MYTFSWLADIRIHDFHTQTKQSNEEVVSKGSKQRHGKNVISKACKQ